MSVVKEFSANLVEKIAKINDLRDITLVSGIDGQRFAVHSLVMAASSEYFHTIFAMFSEERSDEIVIKDMLGSMLKLIIDFCYTGRITLTEENVDAILTVASDLEITVLEQQCEQFWEKNFNDDDLPLVFTLMRADRYDLKNIRQKSMELICEGFENVPVAELQQLDERIFREMLSSGEISANETLIFQRLTQWVNDNEIDRAKHASNLFKYIRLKRIPSKFLREKIDPFCVKYGCTELLLKEYRKRLTGEVNGMASGQVQEKIAPKMFGAIKLWNGEIEIQKFDLSKNRWTECGSIVSPAFYRCAYARGDLIIFSKENDAISKRVECISLSQCQKRTLPNMTKAMTDMLEPVVVGNHVYVFGVDCYANFLGERFDLSEERWTSIAIPSHISSQWRWFVLQVAFYSVVELFGFVYFTTSVFSKCGNKMLRYDIKNNTWSDISGISFECQSSSVNTKRPKLPTIRGLFKSNNILYATVDNHSLRFQLYKYNIEEDKWEMIRNIESTNINKTIEYDDKTYGFTSNALGIVSPEDGILFKASKSTLSDVCALFLAPNLERIQM